MTAPPTAQLPELTDAIRKRCFDICHRDEATRDGDRTDVAEQAMREGIAIGRIGIAASATTSTFAFDPAKIETMVERVVKNAWEWGNTCGIDDVSFNEAGDSHNQWWRDLAMKAKDELYSFILSLRATTQRDATPSGEVIVDCEDCEGAGYVGEAYGGSEFQPPERDRCTSCDGSGKWKVSSGCTPSAKPVFQYEYDGGWYDTDEAFYRQHDGSAKRTLYDAAETHEMWLVRQCDKLLDDPRMADVPDTNGVVVALTTLKEMARSTIAALRTPERDAPDQLEALRAMLQENVDRLLADRAAQRERADVPANACGFSDELDALINRYSMENGSDTPDFILGQFLRHSLQAFNEATKARSQWYGVESIASQPETTR